MLAATAGKVCYVVLLRLPRFSPYCEYPSLDCILGATFSALLGNGLRSENVYA
jgi:hypothetical protein